MQKAYVNDQHTVLNYLVFQFRHINPTSYICSFEIIEHIKVRDGTQVSHDYFQTKVIARSVMQVY
jgi:hypothetical protein